MARDESKRDEQARIVDKLLRQLPHANPTLSDVDRKPRGEPARHPGSSSASPHATKFGAPRQPTRPNSIAVWGRVAVGIVFAVGITQWPYAHACGWSLLGYGAAIMLVGVAGVWSGVFSWRAHMAIPHLIALMLVAWWGVLAAGIILPRIGYAQQEATWRCGAPPPASDEPVLAPIQAAPAEAAPNSHAGGSLETRDSAVADSAAPSRDSVPQ